MIYERNFSGFPDEAPLSDGGLWTNPVTGNLNAQVKSGVVCGNGKNSGTNDYVRILSGFGPDVDVTVTYWSADPVDDYSHENEILLRAVAGEGDYLRCYEVLCEGDSASENIAAAVVRWDGLGGFHVFEQADSEFVTFPATVRVRMVGKLIDCWINGIWLWQQDVTTGGYSEFTDGNPGVGFYSSGGTSPGADPQTGFTYYKADDGLGGGEYIVPARRLLYRGA